ncbi:ornithine decarboxylase 2-like [Pontoporia blainvillei]|uniref:Ornithine decarboxylase 2-like n=1 Tax=Pontoporia blainvillei TaxID=48723 RepID=A0ABX0S0U0_PONBL|nr:ornithine decarboxylase 2-like [Pontoporia blainvillei]
MSTPVGNPKESEESPGSMWPKDLINLEAGETACQVVLKIRELSDLDHQDPFTVVDLGMLSRRHQVFRQALPQVLPFYVVKCNSSPWVLRVLATLGTGFDCASQVELEQGLGLGVAPSRIIYANPCKPVSHIWYTARLGVRFLTFNSEGEPIKVTQHHPGASFHKGSRCQAPHSFTQAITNCRRVFETSCGVRHDMSLLDIGGGFPGEEGSDSKFEEGRGIEVIAEPCRFYAASVCMIAVNVIARKAVLEPGKSKVAHLGSADSPDAWMPLWAQSGSPVSPDDPQTLG